MADSNVTITRYDRIAIQQMEDAFRAAAGEGNNSNQPSSSNPSGSDGNNGPAAAASKLSKGFGKLTKVAKGVVGVFGNLKNLAGSRGVGMMLGEFQSGLVGGVQALDGGMDSFKDAGEMVAAYAERASSAFGDLGISVKALHEFNTQARAASINMGGIKVWQEKMAGAQEHYFARIGDYTEATQHQVDMQNLLVQSGAKAEDLYGDFGKALDATNDDLLKMGVTYKQNREHLIGMRKDENVKQRLMSAAGKKERLQIMLELQARFKHLKALGMSTEQAEAASKALAALSGKGPLDRFKQAAKMQAGMSALGIENAAEVANIIRKGDRASPEEREVVREAVARLQEIRAEARMDSLGREFSVDTIITQTGLDKLPDIFSEKLGAIGSAISQEQIDRRKTIGIDTENANAIVSGIAKLNTTMQESSLEFCRIFLQKKLLVNKDLHHAIFYGKFIPCLERRKSY